MFDVVASNRNVTLLYIGLLRLQAEIDIHHEEWCGLAVNLADSANVEPASQQMFESVRPRFQSAHRSSIFKTIGVSPPAPSALPALNIAQNKAYHQVPLSAYIDRK